MGSGMLSGDVTSSSHLEAAVRLSEVSTPGSRASDSRHSSKRAPMSSRKARSTREQGRSNKLAMCTNQAVVVVLLPDAVALVVAAAVVAVVAVVEGNNDRPTDLVGCEGSAGRCDADCLYTTNLHKEQRSWESFGSDSSLLLLLFFFFFSSCWKQKASFFLLALQYRFFFATAAATSTTTNNTTVAAAGIIIAATAAAAAYITLSLSHIRSHIKGRGGHM